MRTDTSSFWVLAFGIAVLLAKTVNCTDDSGAVAGPKPNASTDTTNSNVVDLTCDLYMAESTIPNAGLGLFTAVSWNEGDSLKNDEPLVPLLELTVHHEKKEGEFFDTTKLYVWDAETTIMGNEVETDFIYAYWPGLGAAININHALENVWAPSHSYEEAGVHRSTSPGAGAFTPYQGSPGEAMRFIPAGSELFMSYGDNYFTMKDEYEGLPVSESYDKAEDLLQEFHENIQIGKFLPEDAEEYYELMKNIVSKWDTRTFNALPKTYSDAQIAIERGIAALHHPKAIRSVSWLKEHGICIDHIMSGQSTLEHAGSGAFAKRFLPQGTIITSSPLHHIYRNLTDMYEFLTHEYVDSNGHNKKRRVKRKSGHQMQLNYCFGHDESTLLLCPYGAGVNYINHNNDSNVEIRWSAHGTANHNSTWLTMLPSEMNWNYKISLGFDYVATKDIPEGSELFLDYGRAWEKAWMDHVRNWNPPEQWSSYESASQWNARLARDNEPLRTQVQQEYFPYPPNLILQCHGDLKEESPQFDYYLHDLDINLWEQGVAFDWNYEPIGVPCSIVDHWKGKFVGNGTIWYYDVELILEENDEILETVVRKGVPRRAISFLDAPYTTDLHLKSAFRHEIGVPDGMFPNQWRDRIQQE